LSGIVEALPNAEKFIKNNINKNFFKFINFSYKAGWQYALFDTNSLVKFVAIKLGENYVRQLL
jgi:hypothetical protein